MGARAGKYKFRARADKYKFGARAGKHKLGARVGKCKFGARAGGQAKGLRARNTNNHVTVSSKYQIQLKKVFAAAKIQKQPP